MDTVPTTRSHKLQAHGEISRLRFAPLGMTSLFVPLCLCVYFGSERSAPD